MFCHRKITIGKFSCAFCKKSNNSMKYWLIATKKKKSKNCGLISEQESNSLIIKLSESKMMRESYSLVHYHHPKTKKTIVVVAKQKPSIKVRATVPNQKKQKKIHSKWIHMRRSRSVERAINLRDIDTDTHSHTCDLVHF